MENPITQYKQELIEWIKNLNNLDVLSQLIDLKRKDKSIFRVTEPQAEYAVKDDFDERFAKGIPHEEMKRRTVEYIRGLSWKNNCLFSCI